MWTRVGRALPYYKTRNLYNLVIDGLYSACAGDPPRAPLMRMGRSVGKPARVCGDSRPTRDEDVKTASLGMVPVEAFMLCTDFQHFFSLFYFFSRTLSKIRDCVIESERLLGRWGAAAGANDWKGPYSVLCWLSSRERASSLFRSDRRREGGGEGGGGRSQWEWEESNYRKV